MRYWKKRATPGNPRVGLAVASYLNEDPRRLDSLACLASSLRAQTYPHWSAVVVHDGPMNDAARAACEKIRCPRVSVVETPTRSAKFGHPHRRQHALGIKGAVHLGFANDDGYYAPVYLEALVHELSAKKAEFAYCDMVHSHRIWLPMSTAPTRGKIDIGCFLVRRTLVESTPWTDLSFHGDGVYVEALVKKAKNVAKVKATLYVHN